MDKNCSGAILTLSRPCLRYLCGSCMGYSAHTTAIFGQIEPTCTFYGTHVQYRQHRWVLMKVHGRLYACRLEVHLVSFNTVSLIRHNGTAVISNSV